MKAERALAELQNAEALASEVERGQHQAALFAAQDALAQAQNRYTEELEKATAVKAKEAETAAALTATQALANRMAEGDEAHAKQVSEMYAMAKAAQETSASLREKNLALEEEIRRMKVPKFAISAKYC